MYLTPANGCSAYSCETNLNLTICNDEGCEVSSFMKNIECDTDAIGNVVYGFNLDVSFADFGKQCDQGYQINITPPFGGVIVSSVTTGLNSGNNILSGKWATDVPYFPTGVVCFDVEIVNLCDQSVCTFKVCFDVPECGEVSNVPCHITDSTFSNVTCRTTDDGEVVYDFDLNLAFNAFGTPCDSYRLLVSSDFGTIDMGTFVVTPGSQVVSGTWYTGLNYYAGGENCFDIQVTNGCDGTSCTVTNCWFFKECGENDKPCLNSALVEDINCKIGEDGSVLYYFNLVFDFNAFGDDCNDYDVLITSPSGVISATGTTVSVGSNAISGYWNTGVSYYNQTETCFKVQIVNNCDQSVCEFETCFETEPCGTRPLPCEGKVLMKKVSCKEPYTSSAVYEFSLEIDVVSFGADCEDYNYSIVTPSGTIVALSAGSLVNGTNTITGLWDTGDMSYSSQEVCFTVLITNACDHTTCSNKVCFEVLDCKGVISNVTAFDATKLLSTYPNPVLEQLNVQFPITDKYDVSIVNTQGQVVRHYTLVADMDISYVFDLNGFTDGVYLIKCIGEKGTYTKTILVRKND